jgi:uncharacterized protein DUF5752
MTEQREFRFSTVAHLEYPAGPLAADIETLRSGIATVPPESLFHHVARVALRHPRARDLPPNDFARWTAVAMQDPETAERLAAAGVHPLLPLEELRASLLRILDEVRERKRPETVARAAAFHFVSARSVTAPLALVAGEPEQVVELWPQVDAAAAFHHLVEARVLGPPEDDLVGWLRRCGARNLAECAESLTTGGMPLLRLHREIGARWRRSLIPARLVRRAEQSESSRRQDAHEVLARIAGRLRKNPEETP